MHFFKRLFFVILAGGVSISGAVSQEAQPATPAWQLACSPAAEDGAQLCELRQRVANQQGQEILRIAFGSAGEAGRELALRTPQGVLLTSPVELAALEGDPIIAVPYRTCINRVCIARTLVGADAIAQFAGVEQPAIRFRDRSGRVIRVLVETTGLTEGLDALDNR